MKKLIVVDWKKYIFEFISIFVAVLAAFALDSWKEGKKDEIIENKILTEIHSGLAKDLEDIKTNELGHEYGLKAIDYFKNFITNKPVRQDSLSVYYFNLLRDFISIQNTSGYETLKSKGLEIIKNDSLRSHIISLYEYDYNTLKKLEEEYPELQFHESYFKEFNEVIAPNLNFDADGRQAGINSPIRISEKEKNILIINLWKIKTNRGFILNEYVKIKEKIKRLQEEIHKELQD